MPKSCTICGTTPVYARGWCKFHYRTWFRRRDPLWTPPTAAQRYEAKIDRLATPDGCHPWTAARQKYGYGAFGYAPGKVTVAHRFGWELLHGLIPPGMFICHVCDNPPCQNPDHWFLGSPKDNIHDMVAKKRNQSGEAKTGSKLTSAKVIEIRRLHATGSYTYAALSKQFGVHRVTITRVVARTEWKHV